MADRTLKKGKMKRTKRTRINRRTKRTQINRRTKRTRINRRTKRLKRNKRKTQKKKRMKGGADEYSDDEERDIDQRFEQAIATDGGDINWAALDLGTREKDLGLTIRETTQKNWNRYKKRDWKKWAKDNSVDQNPDTAFIAWGLYLTRKKNFPAMTTTPQFISKISDKYGAARLKKQREDRGQAKRPSTASAAQSEPEYASVEQSIITGTCQKLGEGVPGLGWGRDFSNYTYTFDGTRLIFTREDGEPSEKNIDNIRDWEWIEMGNGLIFAHKEGRDTDRVLKFGSKEDLDHLLGALNLGRSRREEWDGAAGGAAGGAAAPAPTRQLTRQERRAREEAKRERKAAERASKTVALGATAAPTPPPLNSNKYYFNQYCGKDFGTTQYGHHRGGTDSGPDRSRAALRDWDKSRAQRRKKAYNACGRDDKVIRGNLLREDNSPVEGGAQQYVTCMDRIKDVQEAYGNDEAFDADGEPIDPHLDGREGREQGKYRKWVGHCHDWQDNGKYLFDLQTDAADALKRRTGWTERVSYPPEARYRAG